jgi:hypothetical protein
MCRALQCGNSTVTWSGDEGPWHLLLTPTDIVEHGYNVSQLLIMKSGYDL